MKKIALVLLLFGLADIMECKDAGKQREAGIVREEVELTQEKKDFLAEMYMDGDRIQEGKLYGYQKEVLYQYDYALKYLERKYPSHTFEITGCSPKGMGIDHSTFWFRADEEEDDKVYDLYLEEDKEGNYSCEDNYYKTLLRDSYDEAVLELLQESVPECVGVIVGFDNTQGEEINENLTGKEILEGNYNLPNFTDIYVFEPDASRAQILTDEIEAVIEEKNIVGAYSIYILSMNPCDTYSGDELRTYVRSDEDQIIILRTYFKQSD